MAGLSDEDAANMAQSQLSSMTKDEVNALVVSAMMQSPEAQGMDENTIAMYLSTMSEEDINSIALQALTCLLYTSGCHFGSAYCQCYCSLFNFFLQ